MALRTYSGSCHCGAVRFEAEVDLNEGSIRCNCSYCSKARTWFIPVTADRFRLLKGTDALAEYQWTPPGQPAPFLHFHFCKVCGVRVFGRAPESEALGPAFYAIAAAVLDNADADALAAGIKYIDGRHDRFDRQPEDIRLL